MLAWTAFALAETPAPLDCATPRLHAAGVERVADTPFPGPPLPEKVTRNAYSGVVNVHETENFAIWWGSQSPATDAHVQALGDAFETSWTAQIDGLGFPMPIGSDVNRFNVYLGDTGNGAPSAEGAAGYYYYDSAGSPMIVIDKQLVTEPFTARLTAGHEFHHAVQDPTGGFVYDDLGAWYHEACANWVLTHVFPGNEGYAAAVHAVALRPEISLTHFPDVWTGAVEDEHPYGAVLFPVAMEESHGWELIRDSWLEAPRGADPLEVLEGLLGDVSIREMHLDYAARNATWDYADAQNLVEWVEWYEDQLDSHRIAGVVEEASGEWVGPVDHPPQTLGVNQWSLESMPSSFTLDFSGLETARWDVAVVALGDGKHSRWTASATDGVGQLVVEDWGDPETAYVVVAADAGSVSDGTVYDYEFRITEGLPPEEDPKGLGCGCSQSPTRPFMGWSLAVLGVLLIRRR